MPSLRETQLAFASSVLGDDATCMRGLLLEQGFSSEERMRVYRNNARIGFCQALRAAYPVTGQLGGDDWFESVALRYQRQHPSRCGDLQYVGDRFAGWLQGELADTDYAWFADVAQLEWAYQEVLVAAEGQTLDPLTLARLPMEAQEAAVFTPRPDLRLVESRVPVLQIWQAHQQQPSMHDIRFDDHLRHVLVIRRADHVELRNLPAETAFLLGCLRGLQPLAIAQASFSARFSDAAFGPALQRLVQLQALGPVRTLSPPTFHTGKTP